MAVPKYFVTSSVRVAAAGRVGRAARRLGSAGALALLLSGVLGVPGIAAAQTACRARGSCPAWDAGGHLRQITFKIAQSGSTLSGSFGAPRRSGKLSGTLQGSQVSLQLGADDQAITLTGTTDGNSMTVHGARGRSCTASRQ